MRAGLLNDTSNHWRLSNRFIREDGTLSRVYLLFVTYIFGLLLCGCATAWSGGRDSAEPDVTKEKLQQYQKVMHLTFPAGTRGLNAREATGGPDDMLYLKVEIDREELDSFLEDSPFADANLRSDQKFVGNEKGQTWWRPDDVKTYKSAQVFLPQGEVLNILLDFDQEKKVVIYLMWHET